MQRKHLCLQAYARMKPSSQHGSVNGKLFSLLAPGVASGLLMLLNRRTPTDMYAHVQHCDNGIYSTVTMAYTAA